MRNAKKNHATFPVYLVLYKIWSAWQPNAEFVNPLSNQNIIKFNQKMDDPKVSLQGISMILSGLSHCLWINYQMNICLNLYTICLNFKANDILQSHTHDYNNK